MATPYSRKISRFFGEKKSAKFSSSDFKQVCADLKLQARGAAGVDSVSSAGIWDISNADRLGTSEVDLVNLMIEGCAKLVKMEQGFEGSA